MNIGEARLLATALMHHHGLGDWRLVFDNAKTRAGVCRPGRREIGLSRVLTGLHSESEVRDTILHEIAHALVGVGHGHDAVWRAKATEIGCSGARCISSGSARPDAPWSGACPAGHQVSRYRQPVRVQACRRCSSTFDPSALISWRYRGRVVPMHPQYSAELARLRQHLDAVGSDVGAAAARSAPRQPSPPLARQELRLPVGTVVRLGGGGRYAGLTGPIVKRGRTRYHVLTPAGLLTAPFHMVRPQ